MNTHNLNQILELSEAGKNKENHEAIKYIVNNFPESILEENTKTLAGIVDVAYKYYKAGFSEGQDNVYYAADDIDMLTDEEGFQLLNKGNK